MGWDLQINVWHVVSFLVSGAVGVYAHIIGRQRVTEDMLERHKESVSEQLNGFGQRIVRVEEAGRHAPNHGDMRDLRKELGELHGDVQRMAGGLEGIRRAVDQINQHLLDK
ncbi:MAG: hypothetical protein IT530_16010 [Burkholderiales bacterium]|nr:hypothetical protein [Burkholderiales bacterium]